MNHSYGIMNKGVFCQLIDGEPTRAEWIALRDLAKETTGDTGIAVCHNHRGGYITIV